MKKIIVDILGRLVMCFAILYMLSWALLGAILPPRPVPEPKEAAQMLVLTLKARNDLAGLGPEVAARIEGKMVSAWHEQDFTSTRLLECVRDGTVVFLPQTLKAYAKLEKSGGEKLLWRLVFIQVVTAAKYPEIK